jgi:hypothetical protein
VTEDRRRAYARAYAEALEGRGDAMQIMLHGEPRPPEVEAVASVLGIDPGELDWHVEAEHGHEPHDEGYEDSVWDAAACTDPEHLRMSAQWGRPDMPDGDGLVLPLRQVRVQRRRERRRR